MDFKPHLMAVRDRCEVLVWDDTEIELGDEWDDVISKAIAESNMALLLVSPTFIASDFIMMQELPRLFSNYFEKPAVAIPVYVRRSLADERAVRYATAKGERSIKLTDIQGFIDPEKPLARLTQADLDDAFVELTRKILRAAGSLDENFYKRLKKEQTRSKSRRDRAAGLKKDAEVEIRFTGNLGAWTSAEEEKRIKRIARALEISPEQIKIKKRRHGSVVLETEMPARAALELSELAELGLFRLIDVEEVVWSEADAEHEIEQKQLQARTEAQSTFRLTFGAHEASASAVTKVIESSSLDALGLLDEAERAEFEKAFASAAPEIREQIRKEQARFAQGLDILLPDVVPPPELRQRVLAAVRAAQEEPHKLDNLHNAVMIRPRSVSRMWRAAALGLAAACIFLVWACIYFRDIGLGAAGPQRGLLTYRADLLLNPSATHAQLIAVSGNTTTNGQLCRLGNRAMLAVTAIDDNAIQDLSVFLIDAKGKATLVGKFEKDSAWGMHVMDLSSDVVAQLASSKLEVRNILGETILHT